MWQPVGVNRHHRFPRTRFAVDFLPRSELRFALSMLRSFRIVQLITAVRFATGVDQPMDHVATRKPCMLFTRAAARQHTGRSIGLNYRFGWPNSREKPWRFSTQRGTRVESRKVVPNKIFQMERDSPGILKSLLGSTIPALATGRNCWAIAAWLARTACRYGLVPPPTAGR